MTLPPDDTQDYLTAARVMWNFIEWVHEKSFAAGDPVTQPEAFYAEYYAYLNLRDNPFAKITPERLGPKVLPEIRAQVTAALATIAEIEDRYAQHGLQIYASDDLREVKTRPLSRKGQKS
jgi:hypothetical protein